MVKSSICISEKFFKYCMSLSGMGDMTNRMQLTSIEGKLSTERTTTYRVPKGSVLGPLLFLIYISMTLMKQSHTP